MSCALCAVAEKAMFIFFLRTLNIQITTGQTLDIEIKKGDIDSAVTGEGKALYPPFFPLPIFLTSFT